MSTRFKNTPSGIWKDFDTINTRWKFDTVGVTPKVITGTFEEMEMSGVLLGPHRTADLEATLEQFTSDIQATSATPDTSGDFAATLEEHELTMHGAFIENYISGVLEKLIMEGYANMGLDASLELFSCDMQSLFGASITASFEEIDLTITGDATFVSFEPILKKLGIELLAGASLELEMEDMLGSGQAYIEIQGDLDARFDLLTFASYTGHVLVAKLQPMSFLSTASNPNFGTLSLKTKNFTCSLTATTESVNNLLAGLRQLTMRASGASEGVGGANSLLGTLKNHGATLTGINGPVADLEAELMRFEAELVGSPESINNLEAVLEELTMKAISFTGTGTDPAECDPAEALEFGGMI